MALYPHPGLEPHPGLWPGGVEVAGPTPLVDPGHRWAVFARGTDLNPSWQLPVISIKGLLKHCDVDTASFATPFTVDAWDACAPGTGLLMYRDGVQKFGGPITARQLNWDATEGRPQITLEAVGDQQSLADRDVHPDPTRADDDQTVNDYWQRTTVAGSTAMWQLVNEQAGPGAYPDRQVTGLVMGADPGVGTVQLYQARFDDLNTTLQRFSVASGANLGLRIVTASGRLRVDIVKPRDLSQSVQFAADLRNLVGIFYRETAPTVTDALVGGSGDLHQRVHVKVKTASALALSWGRRIWSYVDRRDTADVPTLTQAGQDEIDQGAPTVSLTVTLIDSAAATWGRDWDLGDQVTVHVGLPGQAPVATVTDVVRQISIDVDNTGKEVIQPAIGSYDAKAIRPTPTQQKLADVANRLDRLITHQ